MSKKLFIIILILFLSSCKKQTYSFDKNNPIDLNYKLDEKPISLTIRGENLNYIYNDFLYNDNYITIKKEFLYTLHPGSYQIIFNYDNKTIESLFSVVNYNREFLYITINDLFQLSKSEYYVLFIKENCYACENIKANAIIYNDYSSSINYQETTLYIISYENAVNKPIFGASENIKDVNSIEDLKVSAFPTLIVVKNNQIFDYYIGTNDIDNFLLEKMKK